MQIVSFAAAGAPLLRTVRPDMQKPGYVIIKLYEYNSSKNSGTVKTFTSKPIITGRRGGRFDYRTMAAGQTDKEF